MRPRSPRKPFTALTAVLIVAVSLAPAAAAANRSTGVGIVVSAQSGDLTGFAWGWNDSGALAIGSFGGSERQPAPTQGGANATNIWATVDAGYSHACGVGVDGRAYCWGSNDNGQLGNGSTDDDSLPAAVTSNAEWSDVSAGGTSGTEHSCGVTITGSALCWGANGQGQLGDGSTTDDSVPRPVFGGLTWKSVSVGSQHTCGIATDSRAYCWGSNSQGQLGIADRGGIQDTPVPIVGDLSWGSIHAGGDYTCAVTLAGDGYCWGDNGNGQLGVGTNSDDSVPVLVDPGAHGISSWASITTGTVTTCGVSSGGAALCWGANYYGELGDGTRDDTNVPVPVKDPMDSGVIAVEPASNTEFTCGMTALDVLCWGSNYEGALGIDSSDDYYLSTEPMTVVPTWQAQDLVPKELSVGGDFAVLLAGTTAPWPTPTPAPADPPSPPRGVQADAGDASAVVSWQEPSSTGSFPITYYRAVASPGGQQCLTTTLVCTVDGLGNGRTYTFSVEALNGAGWSAASIASEAVTPRADARPTVTITGLRKGPNIMVIGATTSFGMGGTLRPWLRFPGQSVASVGSATILVDMDGNFTWSRRTGKRVAVYVETPDGTVRSNAVTVPAR